MRTARTIIKLVEQVMKNYELVRTLERDIKVEILEHRGVLIKRYLDRERSLKILYNNQLVFFGGHGKWQVVAYGEWEDILVDLTAD